MEWTRFTAALVAALVVVAGVPVGAAALLDGPGVQAQSAGNETVNVTTGQQLSTVLSATSDDVQSEVDETEFEVEYESRSDERRAEVVAERGTRLAERAEAIRDDYENATEAYEAGELTRSEYAQRIATLNARAENLAESHDRLEDRLDDVSKLELRAAGFNQTELRAAVNDLDSVRGAGAAALLQRFTGTSEGEIELETADGLEIEVEGEDGEFSREITRPTDGDTSLTTSQADALDTARSALSTQADATWRLGKASVHEDSGYYKFEFGFRTANRTGEAEIRVDGSTGEVFRIEEEIEPSEEAEEREEDREDDETEEDREDDETEEEREGDERELALVVADGTVAASETITVQALENGQPAADVTVSLNGEPVGTTDADGLVSVTLPEGGDAELTAGEGELEFELGEDENEVFRDLRADTALSDGTVTVTLTYQDRGVADAVVYANDRQVGTSDSDGAVAFDVPSGAEELDVEIVKGEFEAEFEYELRNGSLVLTDGPDGEVEREDAESGGDEAEEEETEEPEEEESEEPEEEETEEPEEEESEEPEEEETEEPEEEESEDPEEEETEEPEEEETEEPEDEETEEPEDDR
ncbi:hypothetical protein ACFQGE_04795 [Halomicroarcula sp. GCM10025817]|uniref:DUF7096 domain-containing protein n=1 Tax=Haloarcula TaxID=2237 RepID=UPI0023E816BB|nr:hypothetical protein [Halomicroarcula sp. SYNS111]